MLPVDLTSTWIPLSLLAVLCAYMFVLFQRERRSALAFEGVEPASPVSAPAGGHDAGHAPAPEAHASAPAHAEPAHAAPAHPAPAADVSLGEKQKRSLLWRTARIWLPFLVGFGGQAYLDLIKPLVEKAAG